MNFKIFYELYDEAKECEDVEIFIENKKNTLELRNAQDIDIVLLLRFLHELAHMSIRDMREYLGLPRKQFCERYEIKKRTLEDWEGGKTKVPPRFLKLLAYTLVEDYMS